jgi:pentapeptide repeat protein
MANDEHVALLKKGVEAWNAWRDENAKLRPDLSKADLKEAYLPGANLSRAGLSHGNLSGADLSGANLGGADLFQADLSNANLSGATLRDSQLVNADLIGANLSGADLREANLCITNLSKANLSGANLALALLLRTDLTDADLTGCWVYGISAWGLKLNDGTKQQNLVITRVNEPEITVDKIEVAQFVYLLLHNEKIRDVIDTIGKNGVLLLGRFTEGRMVVLERLRDKLRDLGFVPMVFNFDKPETKDFTETVRLLCNLSHYVIVDITNPRSTPLELQATVPDYMVPFAPILQRGEQPFSMFVDLQNKYDWVLQPVVGYTSVDRLIEVLEDKVVRPAEAKFNELLARRTNQLRVENV